MNDTLVRLGKRGWRSRSRAQRLPVEIEIVDENGALRIADVQDHALVARYQGRVQFLDDGAAHVHFERDSDARGDRAAEMS